MTRCKYTTPKKKHRCILPNREDLHRAKLYKGTKTTVFYHKIRKQPGGPVETVKEKRRQKPGKQAKQGER